MLSVSRDGQSFNVAIFSVLRDASFFLSFSSLPRLSVSVILALSIRLLLSLLARIAATLNDFATHYERNVPHIRREIKVLRRCASPRSRGLGPTSFFVRSHFLCPSHYLIAFAFRSIILHDLITAISILLV